MSGNPVDVHKPGEIPEQAQIRPDVKAKVTIVNRVHGRVVIDSVTFAARSFKVDFVIRYF